MTTLAQEHDCLLLDLDGTVFRGQQPTEGSVETLADVEVRTLFVTNNASRAPGDVAKNLVAMGFAAEADDVVTSAQSAARLLATQMGSGSTVLVIGTEALADEVRNVGLRAGPQVRRRTRWPWCRVTRRETGLGRPGGGGAGDPWRRAVGRRQRRPHAAVGARTVARQRLDGRGARDGDRSAAAGGGQAPAAAAAGRAGPRSSSNARW